MKKIQIKLPPTLHHQFRLRVLEEHKTMQDIVVELIYQYVNKPKKEKT